MTIIALDHARASGLPQYFTGKPCKRGHIAPRQTSNLTCMHCAAEAAAARYKENPEPTKARALAARLSDPETYRLKKRQKWALSPLEERTAQLRNRALARASDPMTAANDRAVKKANKANRRARMAAAEGSTSGADIAALFERQKARCADCKKSIRGGYHADHITPLARGGSNWPRNIQLLCPTCNARKGAKHPIIWAQELGRLL